MHTSTHQLSRWLLAPLLALALLAAPALARAASGPADAIRGFYDTLLRVMKNGPALGERGRYDTLEPAVAATFDIPSMARLAVGAGWSKLSPGDQRAAAAALGRYVAATYADRFDGFSGEKFEVLDERPSAYGVLVTSRIVKSDGEPVEINYLMKQNGERWQIGDVYLTGTISQLATLRSEFASILRERGIDGLIATLNSKVEMLVASNTRFKSDLPIR
jgi:phospholipid transport system substrate-binding protein